MTKAEEIAAWRAFAATMPPAETYSGEWITEQIAFLEVDFKNDHPAGVHAASLSDCRRLRTQAEAIHTEAQKEADAIRAEARRDADTIRAQARAQAERILSAPLFALRKALAALEA